MIRAVQLKKYYQSIHALDGLDIYVETGVIYGFLGPNGAGKTTTLRILSGMARPTQGKAWIIDHEIGLGATDIRALVGVLPEEPAFYPWMTPFEYLSDFTAPLYHINSRLAKQRAEELLELVGLSTVRRRRIAGFSRGMRQRLGLAQALIHKPKVLLLDEPVSALDPAGRKEILDLIDGLRGQCTVLFSSHILADVERVCDVIGIINRGRMLLQSPRDELLARFAQPIYEIELDGNAENWTDSLSDLPFIKNISITNHTIRVWVHNPPEARQALLSRLATADLPIRRFESLRPSLEDIFLQITRQDTTSNLFME
jgi:ABC-2 type transport system ATP-binding protein